MEQVVDHRTLGCVEVGYEFIVFRLNFRMAYCVQILYRSTNGTEPKSPASPSQVQLAMESAVPRCSETN